MELKKAYQTVFDDLHQNRMLQGHYDAINGNPYFMSGIEMIMEVIAQRGYGQNFAEQFSNEFCDNMLRSKNNV